MSRFDRQATLSGNLFIDEGSATHTEHKHTKQLAADLRVVLSALQRRLREEATLGDSLSWRQLRVLSRIEKDGPVTIADLARAESMRAQSMAELVSDLKALGFVTSSADPTDGRRQLLSLTPACLKTMKANRSAREDWLYRVLDERLSVHEQKHLAKAARLLARLTDQAGAK